MSKGIREKASGAIAEVIGQLELGFGWLLVALSPIIVFLWLFLLFSNRESASLRPVSAAPLLAAETLAFGFLLRWMGRSLRERRRWTPQLFWIPLLVLREAIAVLFLSG